MKGIDALVGITLSIETILQFPRAKKVGEQLPIMATEIGKLAHEWSEIAYYPGEPEPMAGDSVLLRAHYHLACARYEQTMGKDEIVILFKKAQEEEGQKRTAFEARLPPSLKETLRRSWKKYKKKKRLRLNSKRRLKHAHKQSA